jgi:hypothetical protein
LRLLEYPPSPGSGIGFTSIVKSRILFLFFSKHSLSEGILYGVYVCFLQFCTTPRNGEIGNTTSELPSVGLPLLILIPQDFPGVFPGVRSRVVLLLLLPPSLVLRVCPVHILDHHHVDLSGF